MDNELLLALAEKSGCMYLSDLKFIKDTSRIKFELERLQPREFSLEQWNNAIVYLTGQKKAFSSPNAAKNFLLDADFIKCQRA